MKPTSLSAIGRDRRERAVAFDSEIGQHLVLFREDRQHLFEFLQSRIGAADDGVQVRAATGEAGAEFVEDDRQALGLGQARDVAEQVDFHRAMGVRHRQQHLTGAFLARGNRFQGRRQWRAFDARLGGQAVHELLADQRLRADCAARVFAEVLEAGVGDVEHDRGLCLRRGRDRSRPCRP